MAAQTHFIHTLVRWNEYLQMCAALTNIHIRQTNSLLWSLVKQALTLCSRHFVTHKLMLNYLVMQHKHMYTNKTSLTKYRNMLTVLIYTAGQISLSKVDTFGVVHLVVYSVLKWFKEADEYFTDINVHCVYIFY